MTEKRSKNMSILLKNESKTATKIDLFSSTEWPDAPDARPDLYRLRINGKWFCPGDEKYTFMTLEGITAATMRILADCMDQPHPCQARPNIGNGTPVRVPRRKLAGQTMFDLTRCATEPIQGIDGRWYAGVILIGKGTEMMSVDNIEVQG